MTRNRPPPPGPPMTDADRAFFQGLVVHEDAAILVFDKPAGLPVQARDPDAKTLDWGLRAFAKSNGKQPKLVHRIDAGTSGLIVAARTHPAAVALSEAFADRHVEKAYLALCFGDLQDEGVIDLPLKRVRPQPGLELMSAARAGYPKAQDARPAYRVLAREGRLLLVEARPETGRMHQIRLHLAEAGAPLLGDVHYGGAGTVGGKPAPRVMLHAWKLGFPHPGTGARAAFEAAPPADFAALSPAQ